MDAETRASILAEARTWINTPYAHKGRVKGVCVDCGQLLHAVYGCFLPLRPMPPEYPADWTLHESNPELYLDFIQEYVRRSDKPVLAAPVLFRIGRKYGHAGIVTDRGVIHAWGRTERGSVQEKPWSFFTKYPTMFFDFR